MSATVNQERRTTYTYGTAARKVANVNTGAERKTQRELEQELLERKAKKEAAKRAKKLHKMNLMYTMALIGTVAVLGFLLVNFIQLQSQINVKSQTISELTAEIGELIEANNNQELELETNIKYDDIYRIATEELGMVYPTRAQVLEYDATASEYVKQYKNIPD